MSRPIPVSARDFYARLFDPEPPVLIDIRIPEDLDTDPGWMPHAHRIAYQDSQRLEMACAGASEVVIACHGGLKLSHGVASQLAGQGMRAAFLVDGMLGWRSANLPLWSPDTSDARFVVTSDLSPDAAVLHWLAARLLPIGAQVLSVAPDQLAGAAEKFQAAVLPDAAALLARLDRATPGLNAVVAASHSPAITEILGGLRQRHGDPNAWQNAASGVLDALALGQEQRP